MVARRRLWIILVLVGLAVALHASRDAPPRPCKATFDRVQVGMTREEVEATVGGSPGDYSDGTAESRPGQRPLECTSWLALDAELLVYFDDGSRVTDIRIKNVMVTQPTVWKRICRRLGF